MGPYCKFCNNRCFQYNTKNYTKTDLIATCPEGIKFDLEKSLEKLFDRSGKHIGYCSGKKNFENGKVFIECFDFQANPYEIDVKNVKLILNIGHEKICNDRSFYQEV